VSNSSYEKDDREFLADFLNITNPNKNPTFLQVNLSDNIILTPINLNNSELNSLYSIGGYLISSIKKNTTICTDCINSVGSKTYINYEYSKLVKIKNFRQNTLFYCNSLTFQLFVSMEEIFRNFYGVVSEQNINISELFINKITKAVLDVNHILPCHKLKKIVRRFVVFRLKIAKQKKGLKKIYASKSVMLSEL
jgi:hypothetical protein